VALALTRLQSEVFVTLCYIVCDCDVMLLSLLGYVQVSGLPFNKYSWIVTHNAFSIVDSPPLPGVQRLTFYNQEDSVTNQLRVCVNL
jgi:hypothetical protein